MDWFRDQVGVFKYENNEIQEILYENVLEQAKSLLHPESHSCSDSPDRNCREGVCDKLGE